MRAVGIRGKHCAPEVLDDGNKADDCSNVILDTVDKLALNSMIMPPNMGWQEVKAGLDKCSKPWTGMTDLEVLSKVKHTRSKINGREILWTI